MNDETFCDKCGGFCRLGNSPVSCANWQPKMEVCFTCGGEFFTLATPMRCYDCVKNKVKIQTSPIRDSFFVLTTEPCQAKENLP